MLNPRQRAVLAALVRGPVEPSHLGDRLELPTATVISHVDALREHGFEIERGPDGFVLTVIPEYGYGIQAGLMAPFVVDYHSALGSTNDHARDLADRGFSDVAVVADEQTGGRGRLHRQWASPPGGIYCSVLIRPLIAPEHLPLLTLAGAVAAADGAAAVGVEATSKWPNDLLGPDGRKLAGVLSESATTDGSVDWVVVGLGLNANPEPHAIPTAATSLRGVRGTAVDRRVVTQAFLESFDAWRRDLDGVIAAWRARTATLGRRVWVRTSDDELVGVATDVDDSGALLIETDNGIRRVMTGDVVHLRTPDDD